MNAIPRAKYKVGERVQFTFNNSTYVGTIDQVAWEMQFNGENIMVYGFANISPTISLPGRTIAEKDVAGLEDEYILVVTSLD